MIQALKKVFFLVLDGFEYFLAMVIFDFYRTGNLLYSVPSQDQLLTSSTYCQLCLTCPYKL